jgi:hypothetical protein
MHFIIGASFKGDFIISCCLAKWAHDNALSLLPICWGTIGYYGMLFLLQHMNENGSLWWSMKHHTFYFIVPALVEKLKVMSNFWGALNFEELLKCVTLLLVFHVYKATTKWEEVYMYIVKMELELSNWSLQSKLSLIDSHASNVKEFLKTPLWLTPSCLVQLCMP